MLFVLLRCFFAKGLISLGERESGREAGGRKWYAWPPTQSFDVSWIAPRCLDQAAQSLALNPYLLCHAWTRSEMHTTVRQVPSLSFNVYSNCAPSFTGIVNLWQWLFFCCTGKIIVSNGARILRIFSTLNIITLVGVSFYLFNRNCCNSPGMFPISSKAFQKCCNLLFTLWCLC